MRFMALFLLALAPLSAQHDFSVWNRTASGETAFIPWYLGVGKLKLPILGEKTVIDARHNFDWKDTAGVYAGRSFGKESLTLIPEVGVMFGEYDGWGPELLVLSTKGRFNLFSQTQLTKGFGRHSDWGYHWTEILIRANSWLYVGWGGQVFHEFAKGSKPEIDEGPAAKLILNAPLRKLGVPVREGQTAYLKLWPAHSDGPANRGRLVSFAGIGYTF